jgi:hypothetical protein
MDGKSRCHHGGNFGERLVSSCIDVFSKISQNGSEDINQIWRKDRIPHIRRELKEEIMTAAEKGWFDKRAETDADTVLADEDIGMELLNLDQADIGMEVVELD